MESEFAKLIARHNKTCIVKSTALLLTSLFLWIFSYFAAYYVVKFILLCLFDPPTEATLHGAAALFVAALAVEGIFRVKKVFEPDDFHFIPGGTGVRANPVVRDANQLIGTTYFLSNLFCCAPHTLSRGIFHLKNILRPDPQKTSAACALFQKILRENRWLPLDNFKNEPDTISILLKLNVIWIDFGNGDGKIRIDVQVMKNFSNRSLP